MTCCRSFFVAAVVSLLAAQASADSWPQFRGPNASGVSRETAPLPAEIGPEKNVLWQVEIPPGVSSPVIHGERIFITGEKPAFEARGAHRNVLGCHDPALLRRAHVVADFQAKIV